MANKISNKYLRVTDRLVQRIIKIKQVALAYKKLTNRELNVADEIGKVLISNGLGLYLLKNSKYKGYSAIDSNGNKVQIKTEKITDFKTFDSNIVIESLYKENFDYLIFVLLDKDYNISKTHTITYHKIIELRKSKQELTLTQFFKI